MTTSSTFGTNPLGYEGIDLNSVANVLTPANRIPTTNDVQPYGTIWPYIGTSPATLYISEGAGNWGLYTIPSGDLVSLSGDAGTATPSANNIILSGGSTGLTTSGSGHTVALRGTLNVAHGGIGDATLTAHGVLLGEGTSGITSLAAAATGSTLMGSTGADPAFTGSPSFSGSVTAATGVIATTGGVTATAGGLTATGGGLTVTAGGAGITGTTNINTTGAGVTSINTGGTGVLNLGNATGNTSVTGSLSTTTSLTATLGNITATNGNLVLNGAGNKLVIHASTAASDSIGTTVAMTGGTIIVSTTAVKTASKIFLTHCVPGGTMGNLTYGTIIDSTSFVITSDNALDTSTVNYLIIN